MSGRPDIERAVAVLRRGGLVAFPTETVYGLGADATDDDALARLYSVKRRPADHPVIVHLGRKADLEEWASAVPDAARRLAAALWPGPLTLVLPAAGTVSRVATGGLDTVGLRVPDHPLALELLDAFGGGIAAPSANRFGRVSPTSAHAVEQDLGPEVDLVLDGGTCAVGVESTIVAVTDTDVRVLRPGAVTVDTVAALTGHVPTTGGATPAPGTLPAHYAPAARVDVVSTTALRGHLTALGADSGVRVGLLGPASDLASVDAAVPVVTLAAVRDADEYARVLYSALREADALGVDVVVAVAPTDDGIGIAVADRLRRAAAGR